MNTPDSIAEAYRRVVPNDAIHLVGRVGKNQVDVEVRGVQVRDILAGAVALGLLMGESARVDTPKQREHLGHKAYGIAEAMIRSRGAR